MKQKLLFPAAFLLFLSAHTYSQKMLADWESSSLSFLSYPVETCTVDTGVANPHIDLVNSSAFVMHISRTTNSAVQAYTDPRIDFLDFTSTNAISLKVYAQSAGRIDLFLKGNFSEEKQMEAYYATPGQWQELRFNTYFTSVQNDTFNLISIYVDQGSEKNWYIDDIQTLALPDFSGDTITNFDNLIYGFRPIKGSDNSIPAPEISISSDPQNTTNQVLEINTTGDKYESARCVLDRKLDFSGKNTLSIRVLSDTEGFVKLQLANYPDRDQDTIISAYYFTPGQWQELNYNFYLNSADNDIYDLIYLFPDYEHEGLETWYFDNLVFSKSEDFDAGIISDFDNTIRSFYPEMDALVSWEQNPLQNADNSSGHVLKITTNDSLYEGAVCNLQSKLDFSAKNTVSLKVLGEVQGPIWMKLWDSSNDTVLDIARAYYFTPGEWQELKFNFLLDETYNGVFNVMTIYPDFGGISPNRNWFVDEILFAYTLPFRNDVIADFENVNRYFENYTQNDLVYPFQNPDPDDINNTDSCLKLTTGDTQFENIKTTLESRLDLSIYERNAINVMVYSDIIGEVRLKLTGPGGYEEVMPGLHYDRPRSWQELSFDISALETDRYNSLTFFPDFDKTNSNDWYFDQLTFDHSIDLVEYSNWEDKVLPFSPTGSTVVTQVQNPDTSDPLNSSSSVLRINCSGSGPWGAMAQLDNYIDYSAFSVFTLKFLSAVSGTVICRLEGENVPMKEVSASYTIPAQWQQLSFNFGPDILSDSYDQLSIRFEDVSFSGQSCYIDDVSGPDLIELTELNNIYADWESVSPLLETWGSLLTAVSENPFMAGINQSDSVLHTTTNANTFEGFAFTSDGMFNLDDGTTFTIDVFSTQAGNVEFKIESDIADTTVSDWQYYSKPGSWQQLVFSYDSLLPNAFDKIAVFPDLSGVSGADWYFDNIRGPELVSRAIYLTADYIPEGREDGHEIIITLIGDAFVNSLSTANWIVEGLPGVTVGTVTRIDANHATIILSGNSTAHHGEDFSFAVSIDQDEFVSSSGDLQADIGAIAWGDFSETRQKKVFVHYMPWYNTDSIGTIPAYDVWHDSVGGKAYSNDPLIGEYSQLDEDVLEYHFLTMFAAGIDGFILNVNPSIPRDMLLTRSTLSKLSEMTEAYGTSGFNLKYVISYDNKYIEPDNYSEIYYDLQFVKDSLVDNPSYSASRFNDDKTGDPVVLTWSQLGDMDTSYHNAMESIYEGDVVHIKRGSYDFSSADANFQWTNFLQDTVTAADPAYYSYWGQDYYQYFDSCMANQHMNIPSSERNYLMMGAVWPGFDDSNASWSRLRWINRNVTEGETMALTFDELMSYTPGENGLIKVELPWIQVVTWNDWPEGATIEPATDSSYGYKALQTTLVKVAAFKGYPEPAYADSLSLTIPYDIYLARKQGNGALAQCALLEFLAGNFEDAFVNCGSAYDILLDVPYSQEESDSLSGAACAKMILDYEAGNSLSQSDLHGYAVGQNQTVNVGADFIDPYGMYRSLNHFEMESGYNYAQLSRNTRDEAYHDLCYWISNKIQNTGRTNLPSTVPIGGSFDKWFVVNGFQSSANPQEQSNYTVYGFYVTDPSMDGVGNKLFVQADIFSNHYFMPISSSDIWNGRYVSVNEPPVTGANVSIEPERTIGNPSTDELRFQIAEQAMSDYSLNGNSTISKVLEEGFQRDRIYFVDLGGSEDDYYIVTFSRSGNGDCIVAAVIDANDGALKLLSYSDDPDYNYYTYLDSAPDHSRLKSARGYINMLYPGTQNILKLTEDPVLPGFRVLPNPASEIIRIQSEEFSGEVELNIMDISGRIVNHIIHNQAAGEAMNLEVNIQDFEPGIYFLNLSGGEIKFTQKLVVVK